MKQIKKHLSFQSRSSQLAEDIVSRLQSRGFPKTYLVGGCVRDHLLGLEPKDFDISTSATPAEVRRNVSNTFLIGRRFKLALVRRPPHHMFEVATFRKTPTEDEDEDLDHFTKDNLFGTPEEDAFRRDFTVNALFYDPSQKIIWDYTQQGMKHLGQGLIVTIGDPMLRLTQDPIRILRAVRLMHKVQFKMNSKLKQACQKKAKLLETANLSRKREEYLKFLKTPCPELTWLTCHDLKLLPHISPSLAQLFANEAQQRLFCHKLRLVDKPAPPLGENPAYLLAHLLLSYVEATGNPFELKDSDMDKLSNFLKQEMGSSNLERDQALGAFLLLPYFQEGPPSSGAGGGGGGKFSSHHKKLLQNKALPLALWLAQSHELTTDRELHSWWEALSFNKP